MNTGCGMALGQTKNGRVFDSSSGATCPVTKRQEWDELILGTHDLGEGIERTGAARHACPGPDHSNIWRMFKWLYPKYRLSRRRATLTTSPLSTSAPSLSNNFGSKRLKSPASTSIAATFTKNGGFKVSLMRCSLSFGGRADDTETM
jgi:hypothetical protein